MSQGCELKEKVNKCIRNGKNGTNYGKAKKRQFSKNWTAKKSAERK